MARFVVGDRVYFWRQSADVAANGWCGTVKHIGSVRVKVAFDGQNGNVTSCQPEWLTHIPIITGIESIEEYLNDPR